MNMQWIEGVMLDDVKTDGDAYHVRSHKVLGEAYTLEDYQERGQLADGRRVIVQYQFRAPEQTADADAGMWPWGEAFEGVTLDAEAEAQREATP